MALPPIPLNSSPCVSSTLFRSSLHFLFLQPQSHATLKFGVSCSNQVVQVETEQPQRVKVTLEAVKKKGKSRPSFFEQIQDKWSLKLGSQREKFPWQELEQEEQGQEEHEEDDEEEECNPKSSSSNLSEPIVDVKSSASCPSTFRFPKRLPPWQLHPTNPRFGSESGAIQDNAKPLEHDFGGSVIEREGIVEDIDEIPDGVLGSKESASPSEERSVFSNNLASSQSLNGVERREGDRKWRRNTALAERLLPEHELRRLRNIALRMVERFNVGVAGITQQLVDSIHDKWREDEVVKLKFESPLAANMKRAHEILESKTGGLVVWRSGSSIVLYRGMAYKFPCVKSYTKINHVKENTVDHSVDVGSDAQARMEEPVRTTESFLRDSANYLKDLTEEELMELSDLNQLLDELGPRFKDWSGREPFPVDADLLPAVVPGYKTPFRLLPHGVRHCLNNKETTFFRRLARRTAPHFALGRNRELQGLANAMVKLWERSAIAKIAIKRGVAHTCNERMAEELRKLTGGTLLSRNKEYIVFYRGNDFLPPAVTGVLTERQKLTLLKQDEEEKARQNASSITGSYRNLSQVPLVAGTLAETRAATTNWGHQPSREEVEKMFRETALSRFTSLIRNLGKKLALAKEKFKKAEKALAKVQGDLEPADLPNDLETLTNEGRFLFRKIGLSMKPYFLLGRRDVFAGTIENMHLHWKYRELVKIIVRGRNFAQVKHIAISLEAESGGVLVSVDKASKGYVIIVYRGKNYFRPRDLRPKNLLTKRKALARSVELQRREAFKHHITDLEERIELLKSELEDMRNGNKIDFDKTLYSTSDNPAFSDDEFEVEENEGTQIYFDQENGDWEDEKSQNKLLDLV